MRSDLVQQTVRIDQIWGTTVGSTVAGTTYGSSWLAPLFTPLWAQSCRVEEAKPKSILLGTRV